MGFVADFSEYSLVVRVIIILLARVCNTRYVLEDNKLMAIESKIEREQERGTADLRSGVEKKTSARRIYTALTVKTSKPEENR